MPTPLRILYAEDEEDDILFMKKALRSVCPDTQLIIVRDGDEAIRALTGGAPPDRVILDLKMPRRSGLEVLRWIRSHPQLKDLSVCILSSSAEQSDVSHVRALGIDEYIVKPVNFEALLEIVRGLCSRWGIP